MCAWKVPRLPTRLLRFGIAMGLGMALFLGAWPGNPPLAARSSAQPDCTSLVASLLPSVSRFEVIGRRTGFDPTAVLASASSGQPVTIPSTLMGDPEVIVSPLSLRASGFEMVDLDPAQREPQNDQPPPPPSGSLTRPVVLPVVLVGDEAFLDFYDRVVQEKAWWEGQEEVFHLVEALYREQIRTSAGDPGLLLRVRALEVRTHSAGVSISSDAYSQLCRFAQGTPPSSIPHTDGNPMLVHLMTGYDLALIPDDSALADSGGGFCNMACGSVGTDIVGLAEGVGGLKAPFSTGCSVPLSALEKDPSLFTPAHHSLSQQVPKAPSVRSANENYQTLLYQRFLLMAHELGHTLGVHHSMDPTTVMHLPLSPSTRFTLDTTSRGEIVGCLMGPCP